ncbi:MAG: hypothetical protein Roseis3KO_54610 [Roseivirga sp.]
MGEIESALQAAPGIKQAVVIADETLADHKRLCGYIVPDEGFNESEVRDYLLSQLPEFMVPAILVSIDEIPLTSNGKIDRKSLPDPVQKESSKESYVAPGNEVEQHLVDIWEELLGTSPIGIQDNFFELGGDSIITIQVVSRAKKQGYSLNPYDVFQYPTIARLASVIKQLSRDESGEQGQLTGAIGLTPIQLDFFNEQIEDRSHYNQALLLSCTKDLSAEKLQEVLEKVVDQHDALRMVFSNDEGVWKAHYGNRPVLLEEAALQDSSPEKLASEITSVCQQYHSDLDIEEGVLFKSVLIQTPDFEKENRFFLVVHHLVIDGVSWRILLEQLNEALDSLSKGQEVNLGAKTASFRQWSDALKKYAGNKHNEEQVAYWKSAIKGYAPIPRDFETKGSTYQDVRKYIVSLESDLTNSLLREVHQTYHTEINDLLLCALARTIRNWAGHETTLVGMEGHGREVLTGEIDITETVGWFTSIYPVSLSIDGESSEGEMIKSIKETLRSIPDKGMGFGILKHLHPSEATRDSLSEARWDIVFNYLGQIDNAVKSAGWFGGSSEHSGEAIASSHPFTHPLVVNSSVSDGKLRLSWNYSERQYNEATIERLADDYINNLTQLIVHCNTKEDSEHTPSDYGLQGMIDIKELDDFLQTPDDV